MRPESDDVTAGTFDVGLAADDLDAYLLELSLDFLPALRTEGWEVEVEDSFPYRIVSGEATWYADVLPQEKTDWFDLELGVEVEGERISLLPVLLGLLRAPGWTLTPDDIAALPDEGSISRSVAGRAGSSHFDRPCQDDSRDPRGASRGRESRSQRHGSNCRDGIPRCSPSWRKGSAGTV